MFVLLVNKKIRISRFFLNTFFLLIIKICLNKMYKKNRFFYFETKNAYAKNQIARLRVHYGPEMGPLMSPL